MTRNKPLAWKLCIAGFSLLAAVAVYCFTRIYPPEILEPFQAINTDLASHAGIFGSAPSFFYTLALGLVIGVCASSRSSARFHCIMWIGLCLLLELTQHPSLSVTFTTWLSGVLPETGWNLIGPYWMRGIFDPNDLVATLIGGLIAMFLVIRLPAEETNADG
jgi:hypothetical protein